MNASVDFGVALLAEGVDRNAWVIALFAKFFKVALLAEGVDRNAIEMIASYGMAVALLAEGVDRNLQMRCASISKNSSPSSRRAWIEIEQVERRLKNEMVALLAEGVDRNSVVNSFGPDAGGRPPRGGRG